jgi:aminoglycoside phosphotransferase (APT) family kinase protein
MAIAARRDPAMLHSAVLAWIRARLQAAETIVLAPLTAPDAGSSSETLMMDVSIHAHGATSLMHWVLRIQATTHQVYQDPAVERQYRVLDVLVQASNVPVPHVLWFEPDASILGAPFFVMERVDGIVPCEMYHSRGVLAEASPREREAMWLSAIEALAGIHRVDTSLLPFLDRPELGSSGLDQEISAWDQYVDWAHTPPHPTLLRGRRWLADHAPPLRATGLAWGDARLGNIVFHDNRCVALLDWETVSLGCAETDLGWWIYYDWAITEGAGVPRLAGIGGRAETIAIWEGCSGRRAAAMEWHEAFATWRFAIISERAIELAEAAGTKLPVSSGDGNPAIRRLAQLIS